MELSTIPLAFPAFEKELQLEIQEQGEIRFFKTDEQLMRTGQYFRSTMLILNGLVKIYREDDDGNEFFMYYLQPGQACALSMVCAAEHKKSAIMAKAAKDTEIIAIPLEYMEEWMGKYKSWSQFVITTYRSRFEELLSTIDHIAFRGMDERLEFYLKKHQETLGTNLIPLNHQEIANELNSSREVISRLLKKMEQFGKVKLNRNAIEIIQL
ncbi:Crp/Fnr family transcriptional regulator [Niastella yeongjuensis]|uniref:Crp/Fnr family transcriptional regulator n=1 Tax=Niastella yeongjuensis TaxID=354355 RepID=A0A1V9EX00_9BACT|nr:Crp/Fnr family transcriptional regulator [Niastella yeongjuensis]OQP50612.1 Crp/Fnr family transcriptional regulator [Niastella yeongjuensis]SEN26143.1 CRP/FNR family transcriptional regulator, anaerobic regulatory protein [Niastella yeongjuensis]